MANAADLTDSQLAICVRMEMRSRGRRNGEITSERLQAGVDKFRELGGVMPWPSNSGRLLDAVCLAVVPG